ncbi:MAG: hypothetical protein GX428_01340, partial [Candidatus Atribacteria bacterium]|nr:hypothetical protein [Candidatus Atribacteria bacterium]
MPFEFFPYKRLSDVKEYLDKLTSQVSRPIIIVPSLSDKEEFQKINPFKEFQIFQWNDLYSEIHSLLNNQVNLPPKRKEVDQSLNWLVVYRFWKELNKKTETIDVPEGLRRIECVTHILESIRELLREEVSWSDFNHFMGCDDCFDDSLCSQIQDPTSLLCWIYRKYLEEYERYQLSDNLQIPGLTARLIIRFGQIGRLRSWLKQNHFIFIGFFQFTPGQSQLLHSLESNHSQVYIIKPWCGIPQFDEGFPFQQNQFELLLRERNPVPIAEIVAGDARHQYETIARELVLWSKEKGQLTQWGQFPGWDNVVTIIPTQRRKTFQEVLQKYQIPFQFIHGFSAKESPLWGILNRLRNAGQSNWPEEETLHLLIDPLLGEIDISVKEAYRQSPRGMDGWRNLLKNFPQSLMKFDQLVKSWRAIKSCRTPREVYQVLYRIFTKTFNISFHASRLAGLDPSRDELVALVTAFLKEIEQKILQFSEDEALASFVQQIEFLSPQDIYEFLETWVNHATLHPPLIEKGSLKIYLNSPPALTEAPLVIITDIIAAFWPGSFLNTPFLEEELKKKWNQNPELSRATLPTIVQKRDEKRALFRRLIATGLQHTILTFPLQDEAGRPTALSPYYNEIFTDDDPWAEKVIFFKRPLSAILPQTVEPYLKPLEIPEDVPLIVRNLPGLPNQISEIPPIPISELDTWVECPFLFYLKNFYKLTEPTLPGFDPRRGGIVLHELWKRVWDCYLEGKSTSLRELVLSLWPEIVQRVYPELLTVFTSDELRLRLDALRMADYQEYMESFINHYRAEEKNEFVLPPYEINQLSFTGRCDRLIGLKDGYWLIVDYKSGKSNYARTSLQLAGYSQVLTDNGFPVVGYVYLCHGDGKATGAFENTLFVP